MPPTKPDEQSKALLTLDKAEKVVQGALKALGFRDTDIKINDVRYGDGVRNAAVLFEIPDSNDEDAEHLQEQTLCANGNHVGISIKRQGDMLKLELPEETYEALADAKEHNADKIVNRVRRSIVGRQGKARFEGLCTSSY